MSFKHLAAALAIAGMAAFPLASQASQTCRVGKPTAASATWNFPAEASRLLNALQVEAVKVQRRSARLGSFDLDDPNWQVHATQLASVRHEVNDMGRKLCRLEQIRRVSAPWQQKAIEQAAPMVTLIAGNVQSAITFLNAHQYDFWQPAYRSNVSDLYKESGRLSTSVKDSEEYALARGQGLNAGHAPGAGKS